MDEDDRLRLILHRVKACESSADVGGSTRVQRGDCPRGDALPALRGQRESGARIQGEVGEIEGEAPVEQSVVRQVAVAAHTVGARGVTCGGVRGGDKVLMESGLRRLSDHFEKLPSHRRSTEVCGVAGTVFKGVGEEHLTCDGGARGRCWERADSSLQLVVMDVQVDGSGPPKHERKRVEGSTAFERARIGVIASAVVVDSEQQRIRLADRGEGTFGRGIRRGEWRRRLLSPGGCVAAVGGVSRGHVHQPVRSRPRLWRKGEQSAGIVVDDVETARSCADVEVEVGSDRERRVAELGPCGPG